MLFSHFDQKQKCSIFTFAQYIYELFEGCMNKLEQSLNVT